ncbi:H-NS histone family protein [Cereibacter sphaeroides]|uniref:H-NS histone family protein n=1 Tax=Rhodobacterales TaxID=204455 RepID=UPI000BBE4875|nr:MULTISPECIES: H-NS family nucleoid-associated regulatory protein [Paracoccaceae]MCE6952306.1 H-NS histone family protein [Cereibacter sphaeroides]MCE6960999.1 H-NS histone family protein [Cereibacter sphaeroides]MCE6969703.1 H-NS histone family protein [Cereibacter sphaeroides]MCE6975178.1 H-NS histone family protein [Cereibacter sphaeroides]
MAVQIERLTLDELVELYGRISTVLDAFERRIAAEAPTEGAGNKGPEAKPDRMAEPARHRYFNPVNRAVTWNGRGRCPNWFKLAMAQGRTPEELSVA